METLAEVDDAIMERYLEGEECPVDEIKAAIRRATIASKMIPVVCGSAFKNKGVQPCSTRWSITCLAAGRPGDRRHEIDGETRARRPSDASRSPAWPSRSWPTSTWQADLRAHLLGHARGRSQVVNSTKDPKERIGQSTRCTPTSARSAPTA